MASLWSASEVCYCNNLFDNSSAKSPHMPNAAKTYNLDFFGGSARPPTNQMVEGTGAIKLGFRAIKRGPATVTEPSFPLTGLSVPPYANCRSQSQVSIPQLRRCRSWPELLPHCWVGFYI